MQQHREDMQQMIKDLLANGAAAQGGSQGMSMTGMPSFSATGLGGTSRGVAPPQPIFNNDGRITEGFSHRLNTKLKVTGVKGEPTGMQEKDLYDNAFLQLQLQECFQVIAKKDEMLKSQHREIKNLWERVKKNLRMQDMLYRDFHHRETERQKIEDELKLATRQAREAFLAEERKVKKYEAALDAVNKPSNSEDSKARLVELTKTNAILEVNLQQKTREHLALREQEARLRQNYTNVEMQMSEMEIDCLKKINELKRWKRGATFQLKELYEQLRVAVPLAEYEGVSQELELFKTKNGDLVFRNAESSLKMSKLQDQIRNIQVQADESRQIRDQKNRLESEFRIVKKRLERYDPVYAR